MVVIVAKAYEAWKTFRKLLLTKQLSYDPTGRKKKRNRLSAFEHGFKK